MISKTGHGDSFAYNSLNVEEKEVEELGELLVNYQNISFLNISKN